jgi:DNA mismatch repair protein MutS
MARTKPAETPLMHQYREQKARHPDAILFFRLGDFYEMFFDDAVLCADKLELQLTSRDKAREDGVPMCGVPHHAARSYIVRLTEAGYKVALCEQMEDPRHARGLVKREVVRVVTPGVMVDEEALDPKIGRYLCAVAAPAGGAADLGLATLDVSTGEFRAAQLPGLDALLAELARIAPHELLVSADALASGAALAGLPARLAGCAVTTIEPTAAAAATAVLEDALADDLHNLGLTGRPLAAQAAADAVAYARATQPAGALPLARLEVYDADAALVLDEAAIRNLELCATLMDGKKRGSLLGVLDRTCTAPGGRLLRRWLLYPLIDVAPIRRRHDAVASLVERATLRGELRQALAAIADLERLAGRVSLRVATPRDLGLLRDSLLRLPALARLLSAAPSGPHEPTGLLPSERPELLAIERLGETLLGAAAALAAELARALVDEPPAGLRAGTLVRDGYCPVVDENRRLADGGKDDLLAIERRERERSGIASLKVRYNRVFGYYLEVTRTHLGKVPADYVRKQTIATGERFVTEELADLEAKILAAQELLAEREAAIFAELCDRVSRHVPILLTLGLRVAQVDCLAALAEVAHQHGYVRPEVDESTAVTIVDGRHPVVERMVPAGGFVPNDCRLDAEREQILLITGPNMAGKSTYMRQVAHIVLLAQMGSFVPARSASVGLCDRIFTRVGAADNLARGESTFMVEMRETSAILRGATRRSLVVLDEVGRGTSTFDGVSIAWAVTEYLHDALGCRALFATHYHELALLAHSRRRIRNLCVAVREHAGEIVFLRRVVEGGASRSYGIDVARLAGLPRSVVARARQILGELERGQGPARQKDQLDLFAATAPSDPALADAVAVAAPSVAERIVLDRLRAADPDRLTPMDALGFLADLRAALPS